MIKKLRSKNVFFTTLFCGFTLFTTDSAVKYKCIYYTYYTVLCKYIAAALD